MTEIANLDNTFILLIIAIVIISIFSGIANSYVYKIPVIIAIVVTLLINFIFAIGFLILIESVYYVKKIIDVINERVRSMKVDSETVVKRVREYFETAQNGMGLLNFRLEQVKQKGKIWIVKCSLYTSLSSGKRSYYKVSVDKKIREVEMIGER